ncbi:DUF5103 domain-containing protein [Tenacibaculum piscium]|uniref:type IX secretion system plug protein n=1 Tax=Tenacibaculum piscium TaxID=1458515 RepID=UPI001F197579|nr:DUF5103 domain-containing protein [Tenacibaculum piscium]
MTKILFIFLCCATHLSGIAQHIKTIQLRPKQATNQFSAIVPLGSVLSLSFDDLDGDTKEYQYKIEQMTHDWKPSNLLSNQYIEGFNQDVITKVSNAFNTLQSYTNYQVEIPNETTKITKSGNYLISVLNEDYEVVFSRRCVFYEKIVTVGVAVFKSNHEKSKNQQQNVQFTIHHQNLRINNPTQEINITLFQNNDWNTLRKNIKPKFIKPNQLLYNHTIETNFWSGNEFLNFDTKHIRNSNLYIAKTQRKEIYHHFLYTDEKRNDKRYAYNPDINGQFVIRSLETNDPNTQADYSIIHFSLASFEPFQHKKVYVYGAFNNYEISEENSMKYDSIDEKYHAEIKLKQGFYNYSYVTLNQNKTLNLHEVDGSFYQTENEYTVLVYYKPFGENYDRVIGVGNGYFNQI